MNDEFEPMDNEAEDEALEELSEELHAPLAYIRVVRKAELKNAPEELPDGLLYALHDENGRPLAIFKDRATAFVAARTNDLTPVSVH